jgi:hypothetical protein
MAQEKKCFMLGFWFDSLFLDISSIVKKITETIISVVKAKNGTLFLGKTNEI